MEKKRPIVPFLFGEDEPSLPDIATFSRLMSMTFNEMRASQVVFEANLVGTDQSLSKLNEPFYLLTRGVLGETAEAFEALLDEEKGIHSKAFKAEMVDILVFIGSLLNHTNVSEKELRQRLFEKLNTEKSLPLKQLLETTIIDEANQAVELYVQAGKVNTPDFVEKIINLAELTIRALQQIDLSPAELNYHFAHVVVKNFIKYRPEVVAQYKLEEGMKASRDNFEKNSSEPITDKNIAQKRQQWEERDAVFRAQSQEVQVFPLREVNATA